MERSKNYIFKQTPDGIEFVGNFERLYTVDRDPWDQSSGFYYKPRRLQLVQDLIEINPLAVLDAGCGFGHGTQAMQLFVTDAVMGIDISPTAIKKASAMFPQVKFKVMNVLQDLPSIKFDVVVLNNMLWYVLHDLDNLINRIYKWLPKSGYLVISQAFIDDQQYGIDTIDGFGGLVKYVSLLDKWMLVKAHYRDTSCRKKDGIVILKKKDSNVKKTN